jgi:sigma-B regulation protein RsbU (phosphoserine phosphatase)
MPGARGSEPRLTVVSGLTPELARARWLDPLLAAWPGGDLPEGRIAAEDSLSKELAPHDPCEPGHRALESQAVLVVVSRKGSEGGLHRLIDALRRSITPAVFVVEPGGEEVFDVDAAREMGFSVVPSFTEPASLARMVDTLLGRQPLVDALSREVRLAQLSQRSIAGELDKLHKELHEAARMQQQFVQRGVPFIPGINVGVVFRPATYVSGDLFDVEQLDEHHIGIFLADAVGHGVPAAMLTLFISRALPKIDTIGETSRIIPPAEALSRLNREFCQRPGPGDRFATAMYTVIDTRTMTATVAGAGHPAAIVAGRPSEGVTRVDSEGPLLGVFPDASFAETRVELGSDKSLIVFSDGFETAFPDRSAGREGLKMPTDTYVQRLAALADREPGVAPLANVIADLESELDGQLGSLHRPDDVTALVVSHDPSSATVRLAA